MKIWLLFKKITVKYPLYWSRFNFFQKLLFYLTLSGVPFSIARIISPSRYQSSKDSPSLVFSFIYNKPIILSNNLVTDATELPKLTTENRLSVGFIEPGGSLSNRHNVRVYHDFLINSYWHPPLFPLPLLDRWNVIVRTKQLCISV